MNIDADELFAIIGRKDYALTQSLKQIAAMQERITALQSRITELETKTKADGTEARETAKR